MADSPVALGTKFLRTLHDPVVPSRISKLRSLCTDDATWWVDTGRDRVAGSLAPVRGSRHCWPLHGSIFVDEKLDEFRSLAGEMFPKGVSLKMGFSPIESRNFAVVEGEGFGYARSGKIYNNRYAFLFETRHGKICSIREYLDTLHAQDVFGDARTGEIVVMPHQTSHPADPSNEVERTMAKAWQTFSDGDIDGFARCFSDDATWWTDSGRERVRGRFDLVHSAGDGTPFHGVVPMVEKINYIRDRVQRSYGGTTIAVTPIRFISDSKRVAAEAVGQATLANGRVYQNRYLLIADVSDNQICALREYCDTLHVADVTGLGLGLRSAQDPRSSLPKRLDRN